MLRRDSQSAIEADLDLVGVFLQKTDLGWHLGWFYRDADEVAQRLDLRWHFDLAHVPVQCDRGRRWAPVNFTVPEQQRLAGLLANIGRDPTPYRIPYSFFVGDACLTFAGKYVPGAPGTGLSCATFVYAAAHAAGVAVPDLSTWLERDNDRETMDLIVNQLAAHPDPGAHAHAALIRGNPQVARFRPADGVNAFCASDVAQPLTFEEAKRLEDRIYAIYDAIQTPVSCGGQPDGWHPPAS